VGLSWDERAYRTSNATRGASIVRFANSANNTGSSFTYDGLGRLVRVVDTHGGTISADHSYFWCGAVRCLAHDNTQAGSPVSTQYFPQGVIASGTSYYYVQDQLGSVIQLVTSSGSVAAQSTCDPYGNLTTVSGTVLPDIGYAGYFYHSLSGLEFTLNRAYDSAHGRWLNRDPIGEYGGINLYAYVGGNPVSNTDPDGTEIASGVASALVNIGLQVAVNYYANGGNLGQAFKCVNANSVLSAFIVGTFLPGAGATIGVSGKALFGYATSAEVGSTASGFALGSMIKYAMTTTLNEQNGPGVADPCGCDKSSSGIGAALHNFLY
jgi:RHS repeat-associated protein